MRFVVFVTLASAVSTTDTKAPTMTKLRKTILIAMLASIFVVSNLYIVLKNQSSTKKMQMGKKKFPFFKINRGNVFMNHQDYLPKIKCIVAVNGLTHYQNNQLNPKPNLRTQMLLAYGYHVINVDVRRKNKEGWIFESIMPET